MKLAVIPVLALLASLGATESNVERFRRLAATRGISRSARVLASSSTSSRRRLSHLTTILRKDGDGNATDSDNDDSVTPSSIANVTEGKITYRSFDVSGLPKEFDWRSAENYAKYGQVVTPVKSQLDCGGCWAFAAIESLESVVAIRTGRLEDLSPAMVIDCAPNPLNCGGNGGCSGSTSEIAFNYLATVGGAISEFNYGYTRLGLGVVNKSTGYIDDVPFDNGKHCQLRTNTVTSDLAIAPVAGHLVIESNNQTAVMHALMEHGPLAITVDARNWANYTSGIFDCNAPGFETNNFVDLNHGVVLVGWGEEDGTPYWSVRNSWGTEFGENGYIRLKRHSVDKVACYEDNTPLDGVACEGVSGSIMATVVDNQTACGPCGVLFDVTVPLLPEHIHLPED